MNLAFYTCFYGSNVNRAFMIPTVPSIKYNCYYFTNNLSMVEKLKKTSWIAIFDNIETKDDLIESCIAGKKLKTSPHIFSELKDYSYLVFFDSKLNNVNEKFIEEMIDKYFINNSYALLLRKHPFLSSNIIWEELKESMYQKRYIMQKDQYFSYITNQISNGLKEKTDYHCACGFLIRNMKHPKINIIGDKWQEHINLCGIQDQISFFFVKQLFDKEDIHAFTDNPFLI